MLFDDEIDQNIRCLIEQWNIAEERIKRAENIRNGEVVASAIFELRYAGRKVIDLLDIALRADVSSDVPAKRQVHAFVADAIEDCVKAKHDAIDAVLTFITIYFSRLEQRMSLTAIIKFFPDYLAHTGRIKAIQRQIENSRRDRLASRDGIYDQIAGDDYNHLLELYDRISTSAERVQTEVRRERLEKFVTRSLAVIGALSAVAGIIAIIRHW